MMGLQKRSAALAATKTAPQRPQRTQSFSLACGRAGFVRFVFFVVENLRGQASFSWVIFYARFSNKLKTGALWAAMKKIFPTDRNNATDENFNIRCVVSIRWALTLRFFF